MNENEEKYIEIDDTRYKTEYTTKYSRRKKYQPLEPKVVRSTIPGTIKEIKYKVGDFVKEGEKVVVLEAMKMKNSILAPLNGKIKNVNVALEQRVPKDYLLFELE